MNMTALILYASAIGLFVTGIYAITAKRHLMRNILGLAVLESGANLLLVTIGYFSGGHAPILVAGKAPGPMVDPIPQALVLTAIVIGFGVLALALALVVRVQENYGTLDNREVAEKLRAETQEARS